MCKSLQIQVHSLLGKTNLWASVGICTCNILQVKQIIQIENYQLFGVFPVIAFPLEIKT